jgi:hypothetical protein
MECEDCQRFERAFLESMVLADRAQTDLRCYFLLHRGCCSVSDLAEYESLSREERRVTEERDRAYVELSDHLRSHA